MQSKRLEQYLRNKTSRWHTLDAGCTRYIYHKHLILTLAARWIQMVQLFKHSVTFTDAIQLRASYYHPVNINKRYIVTSWITANMQSSCNVPKSLTAFPCISSSMFTWAKNFEFRTRSIFHMHLIRNIFLISIFDIIYFILITKKFRYQRDSWLI